MVITRVYTIRYRISRLFSLLPESVLGAESVIVKRTDGRGKLARFNPLLVALVTFFDAGFISRLVILPFSAAAVEKPMEQVVDFPTGERGVCFKSSRGISMSTLGVGGAIRVPCYGRKSTRDAIGSRCGRSIGDFVFFFLLNRTLI